ncbi:MAG: tRNA lysidine(34) synthetase TilS, partial [Paramuribaculum sp.]|nr:tRNA lysidine(34) synthetase TilS [Paramuribaculum sp.]
ECPLVIVGVSGGADSVALLLILHQLGYTLLAAHCNYHLRGAESDRDELSVRRLCDELGIRLCVKDCSVEAGHRESVEMVCRRIRYDWFEELRAEAPGSIVAVAHNKDDNAETMMLNLLRGTGIAGMRAMLPRNIDGVVRPLLCLSRAEIEAYLADCGRTFVVDSSNLTNEYRRNCLRNDVFPTISRHFPDYLERITTSINHLRSDWMLLEQLCAAAVIRHTDRHGNIDIKALAAEIPQADEVLFRVLAPDGFTRTQATDMMAAAEGSGQLFTSTTGNTACINRGILIRNRLSEPTITESVEDAADIEMPTSPFCALFDADKLGSDYTFRPWKPGDRMQPFGMGGRSKKLSDIFNDAKISVAVKAVTKVMVKGDTILWVPGVRRSIHFPVTGRTQRVLRVEQIF